MGHVIGVAERRSKLARGDNVYQPIVQLFETRHLGYIYTISLQQLGDGGQVVDPAHIVARRLKRDTITQHQICKCIVQRHHRVYVVFLVIQNPV